MTQPSITVLMTVFNGAAYLRTAIDSVLKQTFSEFEFLIINDCSTDHSLDVIRSYSDQRIVVYSNEKNMGQTRSMNRGLSLAKGQYIARMDADDMAFPTWLEKTFAFIRHNTEYSGVSVKAAVMDDANRLKRVLNSPDNYHGIVLRCLTHSPINHVGSLFKKEHLLRLGGYDEKYSVPADYDLWSRFLIQGHKLRSIKDVLVAIRFHQGTTTNKERGERDTQQMCAIMGRNIRALTDYSIEEENVRLLWNLVYNVESLDVMHFQKVMKIWDEIFKKMKPSLGIPPATVQEFLVQQRKVIYMKKIFAYIGNRDAQAARRLSKDYIEQYGWNNVFSAIWLISFAGIVFLRFIPKTYAQVHRLATQGKMSHG